VTENVLWQELYTAAMLELDNTSLQNKIQAAEAAIWQTMEELDNKRDGGAIAEMQTMDDALRSLQTLQRVESRASMGANSQGQTLGTS
jgi:hypothetical protein